MKHIQLLLLSFILSIGSIYAQSIYTTTDEINPYALLRATFTGDDGTWTDMENVKMSVQGVFENKSIPYTKTTLAAHVTGSHPSIQYFNVVFTCDFIVTTRTGDQGYDERIDEVTHYLQKNISVLNPGYDPSTVGSSSGGEVYTKSITLRDNDISFGFLNLFERESWHQGWDMDRVESHIYIDGVSTGYFIDWARLAGGDDYIFFLTDHINKQDIEHRIYEVKFVHRCQCSEEDDAYVALVEVIPSVSLSLPFSSICANDVKQLNGGSPSGGVYSINGTQVTKIDGNLYSGTVTVKYTKDGQTATDNVTIKTLPNVGLPDFSDIYIDDEPLALNGGSPSGGIYKYNGNVITSFNPASYTPNTYTITYTVQGTNQCSNTTSNTITVLPLKEPGEDIPDTKFCKNDPPSALVANLNGGKVTINGTVLTNGVFNPASYAVGEYTAVYSRPNYKDDVFKVKVNGLPSVTFNAVSDLCTNSNTVNLLTKVSPSGGTFSGSSSTLNPASLGAGTHKVTYTITDGNGCSNSASRDIVVNNVTAVSLNAFSAVCQNGASFNLTGGSPSGGEYFVDGTKQTVFNPANYSVGNHTIVYKFTNSDGCLTQASRTITVKAVTKAVLQDLTDLCENDSPYTFIEGSPTGGIYSCIEKDNAIANGKFYPSLSGDGNFTIRYTVSANGCTDYVEKKIVVHQVTNVTLNSFSPICQNAPELILTGGSPLNGKYFVDGVEKTKFNPADYTVGNHIITYTFENANGCSTSAQRSIEVKPVTNVSLAAIDPICQNNGDVTFSQGTPSGGYYSVNGVKKSSIDPMDYSTGLQNLKYTLTNTEGCTDFDEIQFTINAAPTVTLNPFNPICKDASEFTLTGGSPLNGKYFVDGVEKTKFNPADYTVGNHTIEYIFKNANGCESSATRTIVVNALPSVTLNPFSAVCQNSSEFELTGGLPTNGKYFVDGIEKTTFNPADYTVGNHTIEYVFENANGCESSASQIINVKAVTKAALQDLTDLCENDSPYTFIEGSPSGGIYSCNEKASAIANGKFYPSISGSGNFTVRYTVSANGCTDYVEKNIVVNQVTDVTLNAFSPICQNAPELILTGGLPLNGKYFVDGVEKTTFNPADYTVGNHIITYTFENANGCSSTAQRSIEVKPVTNVSLTAIDPICQNGNTLSFAQGSPSGGDYLVNGVKKTSIDPMDYSTGLQTLKYTLTNSQGCTDYEEIQFEIKPSPTVTLNAFSPICQNGSEITLSGGLPLNGRYFVDGIEKTTFNPTDYTVGEHNIEYIFKNAQGCESSAIKTITVLAAPNVTLSSFADVYIDDAAFLLSGGSPDKGTYQIDGSDETTFNPSSLGVGEYNITYSYSNANSCTSVATKPIKVLALNENVVIPNQTVCENGGLKALVSNLYDGKIEINGTELPNGIFNPADYTKGDYVATFSRPNYKSSTFIVSVKAAPSIIFNTIDDLCISDSPVLLTSKVNIQGGSFSGIGVNGNEFDPDLSRAGLHTINYKVSNDDGCSSTSSKNVRVYSLTKVTLNPFSAVCQNSGEFNLTGGLPTGGKYFVNGVEKTKFNPADYTVGNHTIEYVFENANGCESSASQIINVKAVTKAALQDLTDLCENDSPYTFIEGSPSGGTYSCVENTSAIANGKFYPSISESGNFTIRYTVSANGCTDFVEKSLVVNETPQVTLAKFDDVCQNEIEFILTGGLPENGKYFVDGVEKTTFNPADYTVGNHTIEYVFENANGCESSASQIINIKAVTPVSLAAIDPVCQNSGSINFTQGSPSGGEYLLNGVQRSSIDLTDLSTGLQTLKYTLTNVNGCTDYEEIQFNVLEAPTVTLNAITPVCEDASEFLLTGGLPIGGKYFVDGVETTTFNPADYTVGDHRIVYEFENDGKCVDRAEQIITIYALPKVTLNPFSAVCQNSDEFILTGGSPLNGKYFVDGVEKIKFNPVDYTVGNHTIEYVFENANGCESSASQIINVKAVTKAALQDLTDLCENDSPYTFIEGSQTGGIYSCNEKDNAIANGKFYPSISGSGNFTIRYTVSANGCTDFVEKSLVVNETPQVTLAKFDDVCQNEIEFILTGGLPENGKYFVDGVEKTKFNPADYTVGNHTIEYVFENANGCESSASQIINIKAVTPVNLDAIDPVCQNSGSINFTQGSPSGGEYLLNGVQRSSVDLTDLSTGLQTLKYTLTNSQGCTDYEEIQFSVLEAPTVTLNPFNPICKDANEFLLTGGLPTGGKYFVDGVETTTFNPANYAVGNHRIVYEFENDGKCVDRAEQIITINPVPVVILSYFNDVCQNSSEFELTGGYPNGGTYLVDGIEKTRFNPADYTVGEHTIDYVFKNSNSCSITATRKIIVLEVPTVTLEDFTPVCENGTPVLLSGGLPLEGKYTNPYLVNGLFRAEIAGSGFHDVTYTYQAENGCSASVTKQIQVLEKPTVTIKDYTPVCENGEPIILSGALPVGGTYTVDNKETAIVNPSSLLPGTHTIKYEVKGDNGCTNYVETPLNILPAPLVVITDIDPICQNGNPFSLDNGAPSGGDYLINGSAASIVDPSKFDAGVHNLKYTYKNSYGCTSSTTKNFTILEKPEVSLAAIKPVCTNSDPIVLTGGLPTGGTYSGDGVIDGEFYPTVGAGTYTIRYTVTNDADCTDFAETTITVFEAPKVTLERFDDVCQNGAEFVLDNGFPKNGFYTINGKQVTRFNPADFEPGLQTITYTFENSNGCSSSVSRDIKILAIPTIETIVIPEVCEKSEAFELELKSENNSFSGDYVINNIFHPELSGAGIFDITHSLKNENGCSVSETVKVVVNALPNVTIADFEPICQNGSEIILSGGFPTGGTYFVNGIEKTKFNPANYTVGKHIIEYRYSDDKTCENSAQTTITVNAAPIVQLESFDPICQNSGNFTLSGGSPSNGFYLIDGVKKSVINPLDYTIGDHEVIYTFENESGCSNSASQTLTILENPEITITKFNSVCEDSSPIKLSGGMPLGGVWTGESVVDGVFYPSIGKGSYTLRYTVKNANDCESYKETTITVLSSPVVTFDRLDPVCKNGAEIVLNQGSPSTGSYTLNEQEIKTFNPANHEVGDYTIKYTYTNQDGCSNSAERTITVLEAPEVSLAPIAPMCQNGAEIELTGGLPETGKYYINNVQVVKFNPADYTHGNYELVYEYSLENGCSDQARTNIEVLETPKEPLLETEKVYCPGEEIKLSASVPQGSELKSTITWLKEDLTSLKENSESVTLQSDESFTAYLQCNAENGCKSSVKQVDINVEKISSNIETNFYEVEQGEALQLQSNVKCDSDIKQYTWEFSDGGVSYERNPWHYFNVLGANDVRLKIESENGCNLTTEVKGLVNVIEIPTDDDTQDIDDLAPKTETSIKDLQIGYVFPNPTTGIIRFTTNKEVRAIVQIRNIQGQLVLSNEMNLNGENSLNLSNLSTGVYLILIQDKENGEILSSQKVMKK